MTGLTLRLGVLLGILFGIIYLAATLFMSALGVGSFSAYLLLAVGIMWIQYMVGPKIVEWSMRVKYADPKEQPWLFEIIQDLAKKANIPMPRVGIAHINIPNAFAFGRGINDGRVCVTKGIMDLLNKDELRAVLAHEISHIKNRDVLFMTLLSVIPIMLYRLAFHLLFFGGGRRRAGGVSSLLLGLGALVFYFVTNLLVLYASRIREYFADKGAIALGSPPSALASALYKLVYGSARAPKESIREVEGVKAFFLNDLSKSRSEIAELAELDLDRSGTIDPYELKSLRDKEIKISASDKLFEVLSTHPNMLKRIKHLSSLTP